MSADRSLMYLTAPQPPGVDEWDVVEPGKALLLRAYFMLQGMFFDQLLVGDSQLINFSYLRSILWPGEAVAGSVRQDLSGLIQHGVLVPALRDSASCLHDVWADLVSRGVSYAGTEDYVRFIESKLPDGKIQSYQSRKVSTLFRDQVLAALDRNNPHFRLKEDVRHRCYEYVASQSVLYHIRMRQWMESEVADGRMSSYHKERLEDVLVASYLHNVPMSIPGSLIDVPLNPRKFWSPVEVRLGRRSVIAARQPDALNVPIRPFSVSPRVLGSLPVGTLLAIRDDPARQRAVRHLERFRRTGEADAERLAGDLESFLLSAEQLAYADSRGEMREYIQAARRIRRHARLTIVRDMGLAVAGLSIWGAAGEMARQVGDATGYAGLVVTAFASVQTLRHLGSAYRHGYAVGRAVPPEHRLILGDPGLAGGL